MVKEIETSNTTELLEPGQELDFELYPDVITASLSNNGQTMTVLVNRNLKAGCVRSVGLYYMLPIYDLQVVKEYEIDTYAPSDSVTASTEYSFDLSMVLQQIAHPAVEQVSEETVSIRQFTYESNTPFNYGTTYPQYNPATTYAAGDYVQYGGRLWQCRKESTGNIPTNTTYWIPSGVPSGGTVQINVPFQVSYPSNSTLPASTDGWYLLRVSDITKWDELVEYSAGDIVINDSAFYTCIQTTTGNEPPNPTYWTALTADDMHDLYELGHAVTATIPTLISCNMLVTRYVKQKHLYDLFIKSNYKRHDNIVAVTQLEKISAMREAAIAHLAAGNPIDARYMLDLITIEVNSFSMNNSKPVVNGTNNFTL